MRLVPEFPSTTLQREILVNYILALTVPLYLGGAIYEYFWVGRPWDGVLYLTFATSNVILVLRGIYT